MMPKSLFPLLCLLLRPVDHFQPHLIKSTWLSHRQVNTTRCNVDCSSFKTVFPMLRVLFGSCVLVFQTWEHCEPLVPSSPPFRIVLHALPLVSVSMSSDNLVDIFLCSFTCISPEIPSPLFLSCPLSGPLTCTV